MPKFDETVHKRLLAIFTKMLNELIATQKKITGFEGPDEGFGIFVAEGDWDTEFHDTTFNSGYLHALLDMATMLHVEIPEALRTQAEAYINEAPYEE